MSRSHDLGGLHGLGPVQMEPEDVPVFDHLWEARIFALMKLCIDKELFTLDEGRHAIERMPPTAYLESAYYERWVWALRTLLIEKGVVEESELAEGES